MSHRILAFLCLAALLACGRQLRPAPQAGQYQGDKNAAIAESLGIKIVSRTGAWSGDPSSLDDYFTTIEVEIQNNSGKQVRLTYNNIALISSGFRSMALPPYKIQGSVSAITAVPPSYVVSPRFFHRRFYLSPYYAAYYDPHLPLWGDPFPYDSAFYDSYYSIWRTPLPTKDMLSKAIPEGVLDDGGKVSGFLYFQAISEKFPRVNLSLRFIDAKSETELTTISIPFAFQ